MAGKPKLKAALAALDRRGGPEGLQQELLAGKTIPMIAKELGLDRGYLHRNLMKNEEYGKAIKEVEAEIADVHAAIALQELAELKEERAAEKEAARNPDNEAVDKNLQYVSQVDIGIAKGLAHQRNFIAASFNKARYGSGNQQNIQINIGDLHLDALRKAKVIDHE